MVHPRPQTPQGESEAKPGKLLLIILKFNKYIWHKGGPWCIVQSISSKRGYVVRNMLRRRVNAKTTSYALIITYRNIPNIRYRTTNDKKGQVTIGHLFPLSKTFKYNLHPPPHPISQTSQYKLYIKAPFVLVSEPEVTRRKHIVHLTGFDAYSSICMS